MSLSTQLRQIADEFFADPSLVKFDELLTVLENADDMYHNGEESFITDSEYDTIKLFAHREQPAHKYFTGVGSNVRGGKIVLPYEMGSLDQVEIGSIADWIGNWKLQNEELIITDKMDGTSAMIVYDDVGIQQIAYSRGNGTEGADISRHIFKIRNIPKKVATSMVIRAEVELTEEAFQELQDCGIKSRSGKPYKNARNMVAGLMNAKENPSIVYEYLSVIAYEVIGHSGSKLEQLDLLEVSGFQVVPYSIVHGRDINDRYLADYINSSRAASGYAIDGIVIDANPKEVRKRMNPTRETLNPAYSIKYKVADASNIATATVKSVTWNISKHGYLKPQVNIEPVELVGVTVQNATGFNAKFISDNGIGPGAKIKITRSGDVIPYILDVVEQAIPQMPGSMNPDEVDWDWDWNETKVDAVLNNHHENDEVAIQQTMDFFASIEAPHLKEGNIRKMFERYEFLTVTDAIVTLLNISSAEWQIAIGSNGLKIHKGLVAKKADMPLYVLAGSSPFFGRGVGKRKFKKLLAALQVQSVDELLLINKAQIVSVEGFEDKTATKIMNGMTKFLDMVMLIDDLNIVIPQKVVGGAMEGQKVVFTGFRDKDLQAAVEAAGGTMQSGVSGKTTILVAKNPNSTSGKMKKARDAGVRIMGIDEFKELL